MQNLQSKIEKILGIQTLEKYGMNTNIIKLRAGQIMEEFKKYNQPKIVGFTKSKLGGTTPIYKNKL